MKLPPSRQTGARSTLGERLRRLALMTGFAVLFCYVACVTGAYLWLTQARDLDQVRLADVALFRIQQVRQAMGAKQFASAQTEWQAKNYQAAYVAFATALRQDPDNIPGRLKAADYFRAMGASYLAEAALQEGLVRAPGELRLIQPLFDLLFATGREQQALELLRKNYAQGFSGPSGLVLQTYEIQATLAVEGAAAARQLVDQHPELLTYTPAAPVVARVWWAAGERPKAIELLAGYLSTQPAGLVDYSTLAGWLAASGQPEAAIKIAQQACERFPSELRAQILLIGAKSATTQDGRPRLSDLEAYLHNYSGQPEALPLLAALAGEKGWVDLARILYAMGANRQLNLNLLGLYVGDALSRNNRWMEAQKLLTQIEAQIPESNPAFIVQLRQRQVIAAAALGQSEAVRDYTRRLRATLGNNPTAVDGCRRVFQRLNIADAVAELTPRAVVASVRASK